MDDIRGTAILDLPYGSDEELFLQYVGPKATIEIAEIMGANPDLTDNLETDLKVVFLAFLHGQYQLVSHQSLKQENKALDDVRRKSMALFEALVDLYEFGDSTPKLVHEIKTNETKYTTPNGIILADLLDSNRSNSFLSIRELLSDLAISAERSIIKKKRKKKLPTKEDFDFAAVDELVMDDNQNQERPNLPKLDKEHALRCAVFAFKEIWSKYTDQPFTEGMYYTETKSNLSLAADALEVFMRKLDPTVTRQNIISAIKWLKSNDLPEEGLDYGKFIITQNVQ